MNVKNAGAITNFLFLLVRPNMDELDPELNELIDKKIEVITLARQLHTLNQAMQLLGLNTDLEDVEIPEYLKIYVVDPENGK